jgi:hypothetical protein
MFEKVSIQREIAYLKNNVVEASVDFVVDFFTCFVEAISQAKLKTP